MDRIRLCSSYREHLAASPTLKGCNDNGTNEYHKQEKADAFVEKVEYLIRIGPDEY
jgi:hypothetical protein